MKDFFRPIAVLSVEDRSEFVKDSLKASKEAIPTFMTIGCIAFSLFAFYDTICLPHLWLKFLGLRAFLVVTTMAYVWAIKHDKVQFGLHSKLLLCVPVVLGTTYMVTAVPRDFFVMETCTEVLLILCTAALFPWLPHEFFVYALMSLGGSAFLWHFVGDFDVRELTLEYFVITTTLGASVLTVLIHTNQSIKLFQTNKKLVRHEMAKLESRIVMIESRLAESDRNAYLAHHLGLFLHEIKNILLALDLMADTRTLDAKEAGQLFDNIKNSSNLARKRIEAFLAKINIKPDNKQVLSVGQELQSVLPILRHDAKKHQIAMDVAAPISLSEVTVFAVPGAIAVVLFDMTRNAVNAIADARRKFPGPTFLGTISLKISVTEEQATIVVEDNGVGISPQASDAFAAGQAIGSTNEERVGIGTLGMRREAAENRFKVSLNPRLGGGTVATLIVPRYGAPDQPVQSGERKLA